MKRKKVLFLLFGMIFLLGCKQPEEMSDPPTITPQETEYPNETVTPKPEITQDIHPTPTPEISRGLSPTVTPELSITPTIPTPIPVPVAKSKVEAANSEAERIPIEKQYFSDEVFRSFVKEKYDKDEDGFLSKSERELVSEIFFDTAEFDVTMNECIVMDGLDWFPNAKSIGQTGKGNFEIYLNRHPGVRFAGCAESKGHVIFYIESCENLEELYFCTNDTVSLYVNNCGNLRIVQGYEYSFEALYISEAPKLRVYLNDTVGMPKESFLDADTQIVWQMWYASDSVGADGTRFYISEEGLPYWGKESAEDSEETIQWFGLSPNEFNLHTQIENMLAIQNNSLPEEMTERGQLTSEVKMILFSPKKISLYLICSREEGTSGSEAIISNYYTVDRNGNITVFRTLEELFVAAEMIEDLSGLKEIFQPM